MKIKNDVKEYLKKEYDSSKNLDKILFEIREDNKMNINKILKIVATFVLAIGVTVGITYAGNIAYEKVFKKPEKIENFIEELKVTDEDLNNIISEDEAIQKAIEGMVRYKENINKEEIESVEILKQPNYDEISYIVKMNDKSQIEINAVTGELVSFYMNSGYTAKEMEKFTGKKEEIIEEAKKKLNEYGYGEEYKISGVSNNNSDDENKAYLWYVWFSKEYDGLFNPTEIVSITIIPKINKVMAFYVKDEPFDNNPIVIGEEEAINIAKEKDKIINTENYTVMDIKSKLSIERMNADVYLKENGYENNGNEVKEDENGNRYSYNKFKMNGKARKVYVIEISYEDRRFGRTRKYYVDTTTGEVIGGKDIFDYNIN